MVANHFTDLTDGKLRIVEQYTLCIGDPEIGDIFAWCTVVNLTEDLGQIAGTIIQIVGNQIQIDILGIIFHQEIL